MAYGAIREDVAAHIGRPHGEIRLLNGFESKGNKGFGLAHISAKEARKRALPGLGFRNIEQMVFHTTRDYAAIGDGDDGKLVLLRLKESIWIKVIIEWRADRRFWSVTTAIPSATARETRLWEKARTG